MKLLRNVILGYALAASVVGMAQQAAKSETGASISPSSTRYFKLKVELRFPTSPEQEPVTQSMTTEVAVNKDRPGSGSCRIRMGSQVPIGTGMATKFIDVGTKFDCNDIHVEGDGLALSIVLETSRISRMISLKNRAGVETEEPVISQRNLALSVKLPLDTKKVIFDSKNVDPSKLKRLGSLDAEAKDAPMMQEAAMQVEMTASELK